uniref:Uncharacterized protein n=1 Tax=Alexandrium fundyense TaxID=2932 RepID=A4UHE9_ALEFU|nr:unknown [Alexandrium fundyense]
MWEPQDIYPTADGWCPPAWPTNEDVIREEEDFKQWPRRSLVKRTVIVLQASVDTLVNPDFMENNKYSLQVYPLRSDTHFSGPGDERAFLCWVYYEPKYEQLVLRAWKSMDVDLTQAERTVVDPETSILNEQAIMHSKVQVCHFNIYEWEVVKNGDEPVRREDGAHWP